jgi:hypothetical protein
MLKGIAVTYYFILGILNICFILKQKKATEAKMTLSFILLRNGHFQFAQLPSVLLVSRDGLWYKKYLITNQEFK